MPYPDDAVDIRRHRLRQDDTERCPPQSAGNFSSVHPILPSVQLILPSANAVSMISDGPSMWRVPFAVTNAAEVQKEAEVKIPQTLVSYFAIFYILDLINRT